jgi:hypothetical protein
VVGGGRAGIGLQESVVDGVQGQSAEGESGQAGLVAELSGNACAQDAPRGD